MYALRVFITLMMIVVIAQAELAGRGPCSGWWQVSPGVGELQLDNRGQLAGLRVTDTEIDLNTTGNVLSSCLSSPPVPRVVVC